MIDFKIIKKSGKSRARLGILKTSHGIVRTPSLVPVATQATVKTLDSREAEKAGCQILIANTFHLHLKPGENIVDKLGGLHKFMNWGKPLMTDSGGFQVFSLGFGKDFNVGKVLKYFSGKGKKVVEKSQQPKEIKIRGNGVSFRSPFDGKKLFLGPEESIRIQEKLGSDIMFAFDECTPPLASKEYARKALGRTHRWAESCLKAWKSNQSLFGIVQGSRFEDLRKESAKHINSLDFEGFGIGGDLGQKKETMNKILDWTVPLLDEKKPRHLLGIGYLEDMENIIKRGVDLFDCTVPTHNARRGIAFTSQGKLNIRSRRFVKDKRSLNEECPCYVCQNYSRGYISHLFRSGEILGMKLLTFHNLFYYNSFVEGIREKIKENKI